MNAVIFVFNIDKEGLHGVSSIKTDIYYRLAWLCFAAISKCTQDYGRTRSTFQNKPQVSLSNIRPVPAGSTDPTDRFISNHINSCNQVAVSLNIHPDLADIVGVQFGRSGAGTGDTEVTIFKNRCGLGRQLSPQGNSFIWFKSKL